MIKIRKALLFALMPAVLLLFAAPSASARIAGPSGMVHRLPVINGSASASYVAADGLGSIYVFSGCRIVRVDESSESLTVIAGSGACLPSPAPPIFDQQYVDGYGENGSALNIALSGGPITVNPANGDVYFEQFCTIRVVHAGTVRTLAGRVPQVGMYAYGSEGQCEASGGLIGGWGISFDKFRQRVLMAGTGGGCRVTAARLDGAVEVVAGTGFCGRYGGYAGENGRATNATLGDVFDVAVDPTGAILLADGTSCSIRGVVNGVISTRVTCQDFPYQDEEGETDDRAIMKPISLTIDGKGRLFFSSNPGEHPIGWLHLMTAR